MIISHKHRFIFLHIPKTAGSSVAVYLSRFIGPRDVQLGYVDDCIRAGVWPNRRTLADYLDPRIMRAGALALCRGDLHAANNARKHKYRRLGMKTHMLAPDVERKHPDTWSASFKFCFVRNPWARLVSLYHWRGRKGRLSGFSDFLASLEDGPARFRGWPIYTIDDEVAVDYVGFYETLTDDMEAICERIGVPFDPDRFPVSKKGPSYDYRDYYGPEERKIVERLCAKEIETFGYTF